VDFLRGGGITKCIFKIIFNSRGHITGEDYSVLYGISIIEKKIKLLKKIKKSDNQT